ncbi:MAG TPA: lipid IV(A) 3-deoxy-D-manno-octulosonic acid transferase [Usitatibacter sp.]|jgi:3-deoxy-D-manno-octulosonic-acid transferase|nr:lipid IV(A) 3-deoxy-D-manno-octulosonic acid transferase [Usitatibacter sp.]
MRAAYGLAWALAAPLAVVRLAWRARRQPGYLAHLGERFGRYRAAAADAPRIWVHAVSVGETRAAAPLVEALLARHPGERILLTHMTPTGRATGEALFGDRVERAWLPYDLGFAVRRFLRRYRPRVAIVLETEIWPRLLEECARAGVPALLANARLSARSARRYGRFPRLTRWALGNLAGIAAQTQADARRFESLGAGGVVVTGNVKFDLAVPQAMRELGGRLRAAFGQHRPVWVAGSTREGEEALLLDAFGAMPGAGDALLVIVPRHPQRFDEVASMAAAKGFVAARRSAIDAIPAAARVVIGDSMGEMLAYYAAADIVVMGGSLLPYGGQNLIEACALARPVIVGPHTFNFEEASKGAIAAGAALRVPDAAAALEAAAALTRDPARLRAMGAAGESFVAAHRGAVERLLAWIEPRLARAAERGGASGPASG